MQYLSGTLEEIFWATERRGGWVPSGLFGGKSPKPNVPTTEHPDGQIEEITINNFIKVRKADITTLQGMCGAGFGNPFERDVARVNRIVMDGLVSVVKAKEDYAAVVDPFILEVDIDAIERLGQKIASRERN